MSNFEWTSPLAAEEQAALRGYKDKDWLRMNPGLRSGNLPDDLKEQALRLDLAIRKGWCTEPITVFRATGRSFLRIEGDIIQAEQSFLSTSLRDDGLGKFFETANPVKMIIHCPLHTNMAAFEHDNAVGEENEILLPRKTQFRIGSQTTVLNRLNILEPESPFNRAYMNLPKDAMILIYTVEPL